MNGIAHYGTFLVAGILLNLTPGNDTLYILSQSVGKGRKSGITSALGIGTGTIVHTLLAAFGLSLVIAQSLVLFSVIKYIGAAYLAYVGIGMLRQKNGMNLDVAASETDGQLAKTYRDAVLTNVFNPKVALFFIAFLPQFVDPSYGHTVVPFLLLGLTFVCTGTLWCLVLATSAARLSHRLKSNSTIASAMTKVSGTVLIGLGVKLALTQAT